MVFGLGLFGAALVVALGVITMSHRATATARHHSAALNLARGTLDTTLSKTFAAIGGQSDSVIILGKRAGNDTANQFTVRTEVTVLGAEKKLVRVKVSWLEGQRAHQVAVEGHAVRL